MGAKVEYLPATEEAARELAAVMCDEDVAEVVAGGAKDALDALLQSLESSDVAFYARLDGQPAVMGGVRVLETETAMGPPSLGIVWLLTGKVTRKHPRRYLLESHKILKALLDYCPTLRNLIDARHEYALRWAQHVGLYMGQPVSVGPEGRLFVPFEARR